MNDLLTRFALTPNDPDINYRVANFYFELGQTASAISHYLRCAERTTDKKLMYESLIQCYFCFDSQNNRDFTAIHLLKQAVAILPKRPEGHFLLCKHYEKHNKFYNCYTTACIALDVCDFTLEPLSIQTNYPGKYGILFERAISAWHWEKVSECKEILLDIKKNYSITNEYLQIINNNLKKLGCYDDFQFSKNFEWVVGDDFAYTVNREIVDEKVYRFWRDVKKDDIVVDIGASVGPFTCSILDQEPKKVYCVEPSIDLLSTCAKNTARYIANRKDNPLVLVNRAITTLTDNDIRTFAENKIFNKSTFEEFIRDYEITKIDFLKIDCEGGEYDIFTEQNINFLKNNVGFIVTEFHLKGKNEREKFKKFRDKILPNFTNYKIMSCTQQTISQGNVVDLGEHIKSDSFLDSYICEFMVYINNEL